MKQTAVEWLIEQLWEAKKTKSNWKEIEKQAKAMEMDQLIKCCQETMKTCDLEMNKLGCKTMDDYFIFIYNETFKS